MVVIQLESLIKYTDHDTKKTPSPHWFTSHFARLFAGDSELAKNNKFDIILMDLRMPGMSGLEAARLIRGFDSPLYAQVPIMALTADVVKDTLQECLDSGMQRVLTKPIDLDELHRAFQEVLLSK